ncbi:fucose isomerase [Halanaerobium praevalens]|uniref:L-fucose isomerase 2 domain protein n=1 Tax=Halanaerobium praevalens (strain ATCC 33744 / DSM 2228 / GSL) TaxID=572479 RepID=E3DPA2_HALPG|nr:fucose isomerase [Halanaerobium praevalens]ADO76653.1 L-fucose isomerase 2 domain protein [Halanaerobium praevalens DSM 2228]
MKIAIVSIISEVHQEKKIDKTLKERCQVLKSNFEVEEIQATEIPYTDFSQYDLTINFIKSGGSENILAENIDYLPQPVYLLATELHNSLPASLEILSFLNAQGLEAKILHGKMENLIKEIKELAEYKKVRDQIAGARLGVVGEPSNWLIGSQVDYKHASHHWGTEFVNIDLAEVYQALKQIDSARAKKVAADFLKNASRIVESNKAELIESAEVYLALKEIINKNDLDALTIRCFDLVQEIKTTGCLALSLLNNEGLIAGCEGDVPAAFSMFLAHKLTGVMPFMANPAAIDKEKDEILFAHCTIATDISPEYIIRSHFETGIGVGIQGLVETGPVTVFKIGGSGLEQYFVAEGEIIENTDSANACRTQVKVKLPQSSDYFLNDAIANHHLLIPGSHAAVINEFLAKE